MASRLPLARPPLTRALATPATRARAAAPGSRVDTTTYTPTGGSGLDSTALSASLPEASRKAVAAYRAALRDVPEMRKNFTIIEDAAFVRACIRDLFTRHKEVTDPKIVDMLVFKAMQELREIREQWKSRHHVYAYLHAYAEKMLREEAAKKVMAGDAEDAVHADLLRTWKARQLVPQELQTWGQFLHWKAAEDAKFATFATDHNLFSKQELDRNAQTSSSQCSVM